MSLVKGNSQWGVGSEDLNNYEDGDEEEGTFVGDDEGSSAAAGSGEKDKKKKKKKKMKLGVGGTTAIFAGATDKFKLKRKAAGEEKAASDVVGGGGEGNNKQPLGGEGHEEGEEKKKAGPAFIAKFKKKKKDLNEEEERGEGGEEKGERDETAAAEGGDGDGEADDQDEDDSGQLCAKERLDALALRDTLSESKDSGPMRHLGQVYACLFVMASIIATVFAVSTPKLGMAPFPRTTTKKTAVEGKADNGETLSPTGGPTGPMADLTTMMTNGTGSGMHESVKGQGNATMMSTNETENDTAIDSDGNSFWEEEFELGTEGYEDAVSMFPQPPGFGTEGGEATIKDNIGDAVIGGSSDAPPRGSKDEDKDEKRGENDGTGIGDSGLFPSLEFPSTTTTDAVEDVVAEVNNDSDPPQGTAITGGKEEEEIEGRDVDSGSLLNEEEAESGKDGDGGRGKLPPLMTMAPATIAITLVPTVAPTPRTTASTPSPSSGESAEMKALETETEETGKKRQHKDTTSPTSTPTLALTPMPTMASTLTLTLTPTITLTMTPTVAPMTPASIPT